jgi:hypothetical protein
VLHHEPDLLRVAPEVAALDRVLEVQIDRVFDVLLLLALRVDAVDAPLAMIELPPTVTAFSIRSTCAPASCASMAAESPAKPVPTITTSVLRSHFFGGSTARSTRA